MNYPEFQDHRWHIQTATAIVGPFPDFDTAESEAERLQSEGYYAKLTTGAALNVTQPSLPVKAPREPRPTI
ncbi:MAG: hypothetical protein HC910_21770 [Spirulinaceae cyanobacterium SM2_1_0]|nr:hypothetical protein [Spirulinaceae cyanobacterium SM2_1_0]